MTTIKKQSALALQLAGQLVKHYVGAQAPEGYEKETNIVTARNGVFRVVKTPVAILKTQIAKMEKDCVIPGPAEMEEGAELLIPKIPFKYWLMVLKYYRDINTKDKTEASVLYFWNTNNVALPTHYGATEAQAKLGLQGDEVKGLIEDGQLIIYCPKQKNSGTLSEFHADPMVPWLREHTTPLLETHSHNTMNAFFSGTDDANENMSQFYAVYGKVADANPAFVFRYCSGQHKVVYDPSILFDFPQVKTTVRTTFEFEGTTDMGVPGFEPIVQEEETYSAYTGPWPDVDYPDDWMGQHTKSGYAYNRSTSTYKGSSYTPSTKDHRGYDDYYGDGGWGAYLDRFDEEAKAGNGALKKNFSEEENVVETGLATVEIEAQTIISELTREQMIDLVHEISTFGYDHIIAEALEDIRHKR